MTYLQDNDQGNEQLTQAIYSYRGLLSFFFSCVNATLNPKLFNSRPYRLLLFAAIGENLCAITLKALKTVRHLKPSVTMKCLAKSHHHLTRMLLILCAILISLLQVSARSSKISNSGSLYKETDTLNILNGDNFELLVYGKETAFLVEFYANWCGFCQRFAPKFARFARDVVTWRSVMQVGAVDCGNERNTDLCRDQKVLAFPSLRLLPPNSRRGEPGYDIQVPEFTIPSIRHAVMDTLVGYSMKYPQPNWPDFNSVNGSQKIELFMKLKYEQLAPSVEKPIVIIIEDKDSPVGNEVRT